LSTNTVIVAPWVSPKLSILFINWTPFLNILGSSLLRAFLLLLSSSPGKVSQVRLAIG
jgi:hypothetical protein